ncbi:MAG TPA: amino acid permease [Prosthecobacter sp.]|nr:amino acid permease [Prosthecobacter sp.]
MTPSPEPAPSYRGISVITATAVVVANMVGTGIFTSLGFQVGDLPSGFVIVVLWTLGGLCAFCGALAYGELAAALPRSGGEYHFLSKIFHPAVGFAAGWLSATVGFAAPIALAAMAFGKYFSGITDKISATTLSLVMVWLVTTIHISGIKTASRFQNTATWLKVLLILVFIGAGILWGESQPVSFAPQADSWKLITSTPFAVSLVYVMYAYAGWNASTYIVGEIRNPQRNVPISLAVGTAFVTVLYVALNAIFMHVTPIGELAGKVQVGHAAADHIFGATGGKIMSGLICLGLVSAISAMTWVGPRVAMTMGQDVRVLAPLSVKTASGVPVAALFAQLAIVITLILTASFATVLTYVQFSIQLCSFATVVGLMVLRWKQPDLPRPCRCWGYPVTPLIFLAISLWMMIYLILDRLYESLAGLATIGLGLLIYFISPKSSQPQ